MVAMRHWLTRHWERLEDALGLTVWVVALVSLWR